MGKDQPVFDAATGDRRCKFMFLSQMFQTILQ